MNKVLIIDNYDSFTYILKQYFGELKANPEVYLNDQITVAQIKRIKPSHIVLSPGPGTVKNPKDVGIMFDLIKEFYKKIPILGVCLGHQAIGKFFGGKIIQAPEVMHGKRSLIYHDKKGIFQGIKNPFSAMRYHSLALAIPNDQYPRPYPARSGSGGRHGRAMTNLTITASSNDEIIMGIRHKEYPIFGVQFHPESLGTPEGKKIIRNFLKYQ